MTAEVEGIDEVLRNINRELQGVENRGMDGLFDAGLQVQRVSQSRTPVDTSNLKGSAYTRKAGGGVEVGYTANYAIFVHENMEARHTNGQAKFLESALRDNASRIVDIVRRRAEIK